MTSRLRKAYESIARNAECKGCPGCASDDCWVPAALATLEEAVEAVEEHVALEEMSEEDCGLRCSIRFRALTEEETT